MSKSNQTHPSGRGHSAIVVGGSLSGLMSALALRRAGFRVTILERSAETGRTGAALHAPGDLIHQLTGAPPKSALRLFHGTQTWFGIHRSLRAEAEADGNIVLMDGCRVTEAGQHELAAWVKIDAGETLEADLVVGADGHRSVVRAAVSPEHASARFAGYLIWIGVAQESAIPARNEWPTSAAILSGGRHYFLGVSVPGKDGTNSIGRRQLAWALYDAGWNGLLEETGWVRDGIVHHTLAANEVPAKVIEHIRRRSGLWPTIWQDAILDCVRRKSIIGTPVAEYLPQRLTKGRLVLVGDAAHVPTPMTGSGFSTSVADAIALGTCLQNAADVIGALERYEKERIQDAQDLVRGGQQFSRSFASF